ncbi:hypothetical protein PENTCL1PPCAC_23651, partial [Pristionchus entomophagus]
FDGFRASLGEIEPGTVGHRTLSVYLERHERWVEENNECADGKENVPVPSPLRYHARVADIAARAASARLMREMTRKNQNDGEMMDKVTAKKVRFEGVEDETEM